MKKKGVILILLVSIFTFNLNVYATSGSLSVSSSNVYVGDTFTVTVDIKGVAAWNIHVSSNGPVADCIINQANATDDALDTNKTFTAKCKTKGEGIITVRLSGDVTSENGKTVNLSGSKTVNVSKKTTVSSSNNTYNDGKAKNNNLQELSVENYELVKVDTNNYTLLLPNDVNSINIKAIAEDTKAKVTGDGRHDINIGENNIEIVVTAENGAKNKINIKVTRKDGYYLEDLDSVLKNNLEDINITIKNDTKISAQDLEKIKNSKKIVKFNYCDNGQSLMYSWIVDGSKLGNVSDLLTTISYDSENRKDMLVLSNYADGIFVSLKQLTNLQNGIIVKLFVGDKYSDSDLVSIYSYVKDDNKFQLIKDKAKIIDGYVEFNVASDLEYFITMSMISSDGPSTKKTPMLPIVLLLVGLFVGGGIVHIFKSKKNTMSTVSTDNYQSINSNYGINSNNNISDSINNSLGQNDNSGNKF